MPLISILLPAYNASKYIKEAIDSVLQQTLADFELIIINDGSNDNTKEIILSYSDSRIVYVENEINLKLIKTLNKGIDLAKGKYIARMDADDIALPNWLEIQYNFIITHDADVVSGHLLYLSDNGKEIYHNEKSKFFLQPKDIANIILFDNCLSHPGIFIKADILKKYKYNDTNKVIHFEDFDLWNRLCKDNIQIWNHTTPIILWRLTPTSISHTYKTETITQINEYKKRNISQNYNINPNDIDILFNNKKINIQQTNYLIKLFKKISISQNTTKSFNFWSILFLLQLLKKQGKTLFNKTILSILVMLSFPKSIQIIPKILLHNKKYITNHYFKNGK